MQVDHIARPPVGLHRVPMVPLCKSCKVYPKWVPKPGEGSAIVASVTRRAIIVLLALVIVALGFAKLANDELRRSTRATTHQLDGRRVMASADAPRAAGAPGGPSGGSDVAPVYAEFVAPRPSPPRAASAMTPASRPMGADALGTSLPKRRRWAALGGHGRNGAG